MPDMALNDYITKSRKIKKDNRMKEVRLAFLSNFTISGLADTMKAMCGDIGVFVHHYTSPYNQYAQDILDKSSHLHKFGPDMVFVLLDAENLLGDFYFFPYRMDPDGRRGFIEEKFDHVRKLLQRLVGNTKAKVVVNTIIIPQYYSRGIIEDRQEWGMNSCI